MEYRTLKSIFHRQDRDGADAQERARRQSPAALHWDLPIGEHSLFALMTPEITVLIERILSFEPKIRAEWEALPGRARLDYLHRMVTEEIQASNEIEQVRSTRKEIGEAIKAVELRGPAAKKRFVEMARLYLDIGRSEVKGPQTLGDIRAIYDAVTRGEIPAQDAPDGRLFGRGPVSVESGTKVIHNGPVPETAIDAGLTVMLSQARDDSIPRLIRAAAAHFIFEYTHPFYDGNGRTGRYLLALDLRAVLAEYASLSLSSTIADNKDRYYRAFADAENPLNRGDLTPFLVTMLELIAEAQNRLLLDLSKQARALAQIEERIAELVRDERYPLSAGLAPGEAPRVEGPDLAQVLYTLGQAHLFDANPRVRLNVLAEVAKRSTQYLRPRLQRLVDAGIVEMVTRNPLRFRLGPRGVVLLGLDGA